MHVERQWEMVEFEFSPSKPVKNPFWDVTVWATFKHMGSSAEQRVWAFYDGQGANGEQLWRVRWTPSAAGRWLCTLQSAPASFGFATSFEVDVVAASGGKGFLRADPSAAYGFRFDNGEPFFLFGDTMYNIFGAHYSGVDADGILRHRKGQGVNYVRARLAVSPYHPETANSWQARDLWPWGGSAQLPDFKRLNLDYFRAVDEVVARAAELGIGLEMVLEAWLWEFPWNDRSQFLPEYEELWVQYIVARYAAYPSVYLWCPANEYEFYPGPIRHNPESERWIDRLCRMVRHYDPFAHPIGIHNWGAPQQPLTERLGHLDSFDVYLYQTNWGREAATFKRDASLCMWLEQDVAHHFPVRERVVVCSEFGYERVQGLYTAGSHERLDEHHTRRGQWRAGFSGLSVVHGFNNTWGPHMRIDKDALGARYLPIYYRFMTEHVDFSTLRPAPALLTTVSGDVDSGSQPLCLASEDRHLVTVYFPAQGEGTVRLDEPASYECTWFDPRFGDVSKPFRSDEARFSTPLGKGPWEDDWVLVLRRDELP